MDFIGGAEILASSLMEGTGETEVTFLQRVDCTDFFFLSGKWKDYVDEREHKELIKIGSLDEARKLLDKDAPMMHGTLAGLENLVADDFNSL